MCRFLMVMSSERLNPGPWLDEFAVMAEKSRASNGDRQGDGWGVAWLTSGGEWECRKSLLPIWKEKEFFPEVPPSRSFLVHARSASFKHQIGDIGHIQPFHERPFAFVFNGYLHGVSLPEAAGGGIGSQRIWRLLLRSLRQAPPETSLRSLADLLVSHCRRVQALNVGLCDSSSLYAFSRFSQDPEYYTLYAHRSMSLRMISSEPLGGHRFVPLPQDRVVSI